MSITPKRRCTDSLKDSMNYSMEKRIKRISIEGNIGKDIFHESDDLCNGIRAEMAS